MAITQTSLIEVRWTAHKGRGIFARTFIPAGTVIERAPVLVMPAAEVLATEDDTVLSHYLFEWGKGTVALALGFGSLYNHSYSPNARYEDAGRQLKLYIAVRDIEPGEEVTINYNGSAEATDPVWFHVIENQSAAESAAPPAKKSRTNARTSGTTAAASEPRRRAPRSSQARKATPAVPPTAAESTERPATARKSVSRRQR